MITHQGYVCIHIAIKNFGNQLVCLWLKKKYWTSGKIKQYLPLYGLIIQHSF